MNDFNHAHTEQQHDWAEQPQPFLAFAEDLRVEHERLSELAERCRGYAQELSSREAGLSERENWVSEAQERFAEQVRELARREEDVNGKFALVEEAERRLENMRQRETELAALGTELMTRFGSPEQV